MNQDLTIDEAAAILSEELFNKGIGLTRDFLKEQIKLPLHKKTDKQVFWGIVCESMYFFSSIVAYLAMEFVTAEKSALFLHRFCNEMISIIIKNVYATKDPQRIEEIDSALRDNFRRTFAAYNLLLDEKLRATEIFSQQLKETAYDKFGQMIAELIGHPNDQFSIMLCSRLARDTVKKDNTLKFLRRIKD